MIPFNQIVDSNGYIWTIDHKTRTVLKNGVLQSQTGVQELWYVDGVVWAFLGTGWTSLTTSDTTGPVWWKTPALNISNTSYTLAMTPGLRVNVGPQVLTFTANGANTFAEGVRVNPGDNLQSIINANPAGTIYCLTKGTYAQQSIVPQDGDIYYGEYDGTNGVIFDAQSVPEFAFSGGANNVQIRNIFFKNYTAPTQFCAVQLVGLYDLIQNCDLRYATQGGAIWLSSYGMAIANMMANNAQLGYKAVGWLGADNTLPCVGALFDSNEISHNNPTAAFWDSGEQGGGKVGYTQQTNFWFNYSHDNGFGPGFWADTNNWGTEYLFNVVANNTDGITHEICFNARMMGNHVSGTGSPVSTTDYFSGSCFEINNSQGIASGAYAGIIEIAYNTVVPGPYGRSITMVQQNRGSLNSVFTTANYEWVLKNIRVHHNSVDMSGGLSDSQVGLVYDYGTTAIYTANNITWDYNTYKTGNNGFFTWSASPWEDFPTWQSEGNDVHGSATT
jgi:hypothetical protein